MCSSLLNFNVGVLGHVDSGKTSLSKALSTVASTASFDKNPQSQERGITLDLGFSSFSVDIPDHIKTENSKFERLQFTLVDCPGHASLIRTIIGGAQIIDLMILVIDVMKGIQTQTAECLVLGEITCNHMIVVLNKIDLLPNDKMEASIQKMSKKILKTLERTKFKNSVIIPVSAKPNSENVDIKPIGIDNLVDCLKKHAYIPRRSAEGTFVFAVDHCFAIKGQGTVMTGTILQGKVSVLDTVEIPTTKVTKKVKSIQMFKKPIQSAMQGDRVGVCVTQFDPKDLERGVVSTPGYMETTDTVIATVNKIPYFKGKCLTNSKFHISILHDTVIAKCVFFTAESALEELTLDEFNYAINYIYLDEISELNETRTNELKQSSIFVLLQFANPVVLGKDTIYIASRLETDIHANICRLAFHGKILSLSSAKLGCEILPKLKIYKEKMKVGIVERMVNEYQIIVKDLFKKETNIQIFTNLKVILSTGEEGIIEGSFGQSGKVNVRIPNGLCENTLLCLKSTKKGKHELEKEKANQIHVKLRFKKYVYHNQKKIFQSK